MLGDDIEKSRVDYATKMETELKRLAKERDAALALARMHEIDVQVRIGDMTDPPDGRSAMIVNFTFQGKMFSVRVSAEKVVYYKMDPAALLDHVVGLGIKNLVHDRIVEQSTQSFSTVMNNICSLYEKGALK